MIGPAMLSVAFGPDVWDRIFNFTDYSELLALVHNSILAGLVIGIAGGLISTFVMMRDLPFAVHGISELSFAGASAALLLGLNVVAGSLVGSILAAALIGALGVRARDRNSIIGVIMPFGLGLGVLFLALYKGRSANKFGLLTGQIVAIDTPQLSWLLITAAIVVLGLTLIWRPLTFASIDPDVAAARGIPVAGLSLVFMLLLSLVVAASIQVVGALLVLSVVCTPGAAAIWITRSPALAALFSMLFATTSIVGGILLSLGSSIPISPYVTTISFTIYLLCRVFGASITRRAARGTKASDQARRSDDAMIPARP